MFERFTDGARRAVVLGQEEARLLDHAYVGTEHLLLGLLHEGEGVAAQSLESLEISLEAARGVVEEIIGHGRRPTPGHLPFTPRAKEVCNLALREALRLGHDHVGTGHMLLGLIRERRGVAVQVLVKLGAGLDRVREIVIANVERGVGDPDEIDGARTPPVLRAPARRFPTAEEEEAHRRFVAWVMSRGRAESLRADRTEYALTVRCVPCGIDYISGTVLCPECMGTDIQSIRSA